MINTSSSYPKEFNTILNIHKLSSNDIYNIVGTFKRLNKSLPTSDIERDKLIEDNDTQSFSYGFMAVINDPCSDNLERHFHPWSQTYNDGVSAGISYRLNNTEEFSYEN